MTSREVATAVGEAPGSLEARAAELRKIIGTKTAQEEAAAELATVEPRLAAQKRAENMAALKCEAEQRLTGRGASLAAAVGSLAAAAEQDDYRVLQTAQAYAKAMRTLDERFVTYVQLRDEATRLAAAFGLPMPTLATMPIPGRREAVDEARRTAFDVPVRGTAYGVGLDDATDEFAKTKGGQIVARLRALGA
jgi:hypothetical protein